MSTGYERRIGRYGPKLAEGMTAIGGVAAGQRVLDLGCGSGALAEACARITGGENVVGLDSSAADLEAARRRVPGASFHHGRAEELPFEDASFDAALAQLLVHLVDDAPAVAREMRRVARPGGVVATCVWDFADAMTPLRAFWDAAAVVVPDLARVRDQGRTRPFATRSDLALLWEQAGLAGIETGEIWSASGYEDFEDLWQPMTIPDGSPGYFCAELGRTQLAAVRDEMFRRVGEPEGGFTLEARAWYVRGRA